MRNRFFFIILTTLVLGALGISGITSYFFRSQRLHLIDQQIKKSTETLLRSAQFKKAVNGTAVDEAITAALGGDRIGKAFIVRDANGKILLQSFNVALLQVELPTEEEWVTVQTAEQYVRILNSPLDGDKTLQVGLVLDNNFINWRILDARTKLLISGLVVLVFVISALLTLVLLAPIRQLNAHLSRATSDLKNLKDVDPLPKELIRSTKAFWAKSDEFSSLVATVQKLVDRINLNYKLTRSWTYQMTHELKTPLAVIRAETESNLKAGQLPQAYGRTVLNEVDWTSETITQFLSWAELENSQPQKHLHVVRISVVLQNVRARLEKLQPKRIELAIDADFSIAASPGHLDQLVTNIVTNALKFSRQDTPVTITAKDNTVSIRDQGPGIPKEVMEQLGQPFNVGYSQGRGNRVGHGLGLAWVSTVTKLYGWKLTIETSASGTCLSVRFPMLD